MIVKYPIGVQWSIVEKELQESRNRKRPRLQSPCGCTEVQYHVVFYPDGNSASKAGQACLFFGLRSKEKRAIEFELTWSIESANFSLVKKEAYQGSYEYEGPLFPAEDLFNPEKRFIVDGEMIIKVEGFVMMNMEDANEIVQLGSSKIELGLNLWDDEKKGFRIVAEGKEIRVHECVLEARSPVFKAMFQSHTKEALEGEVVIPDFSFAVVETAIKFCYDSSLVENVPFDDQLSLLQFFDKYDMQLFRADLENHLIAQINETNVCRLANCSIISNAHQLRLKCKKFLHGCLKKKAVSNFEELDIDFAMDLLKNSLCDCV